MTEPCEHLEYRDTANGASFAHERPFCTVVEEFVQPMRADICAARYGLDPAEDCEYYREEHDLGSVTGFAGDPDRTGESDDAEPFDASDDAGNSEADS
ncbi:hypothetical protein [Halolamina sp.]|jgi:hypothetical protein|uniref:hypothetical protein n=1 Tax=Halolamina sp. TaxID=1940283 RepID=UPI000223B462|nr:hypothetical protein Halar_1560 [halophilic archaeon DL31]